MEVCHEKSQTHLIISFCSEKAAHVWHCGSGVPTAWQWGPEEAWGHLVYSIYLEVSAHRYVSVLALLEEDTAVGDVLLGWILMLWWAGLSSCVGKKNGEEDKVGCMIIYFILNIILDEVNYRLLLNVTNDTDSPEWPSWACVWFVVEHSL